MSALKQMWKRFEALPAYARLIIFLLVVTVVPYFLSTLIQPHRHAQVSGCLDTVDRTYTNTCDRPINLGVCWSGMRGACGQTATLAAGQSRLLDSFEGERLATSETGAWVLVKCEVPFRPAMVSSSSSNVRLERGCMQP